MLILQNLGGVGGRGVKGSIADQDGTPIPNVDHLLLNAYGAVAMSNIPCTSFYYFFNNLLYSNPG